KLRVITIGVITQTPSGSGRRRVISCDVSPAVNSTGSPRSRAYRFPNFLILQRKRTFNSKKISENHPTMHAGRALLDDFLKFSYRPLEVLGTLGVSWSFSS